MEKLDNTNTLELIDNILIQPINTDNSVVSTYLLSELFINYINQQNRKERSLHKKLEDILNKKFLDCHSNIHYYKGTLVLVFDRKYSSEKKIFFGRSNGEIYIIRSDEHRHDKKILNWCHDALNDIFDFNENKIKIQSNITAVNYPFKISVSNFIDPFVTVYIKRVHPTDCVFYVSKGNNGYELKCNSDEVSKIVKGNESKIFKNTYVKISDCPKFLQDDLKKYRSQEIISRCFKKR